MQPWLVQSRAETEGASASTSAGMQLSGENAIPPYLAMDLHKASHIVSKISALLQKKIVL